MNGSPGSLNAYVSNLGHKRQKLYVRLHGPTIFVRDSIRAVDTGGAAAAVKNLLIDLGFTGVKVYAAARAQLARKE